MTVIHMNYIQGYKDGIHAVLEVLRGLADAAQAQAHSKYNKPGDQELAEISCAILRSTRETILENCKAMVTAREQQLTPPSGRVQ